jgi:hypothetical protein
MITCSQNVEPQECGFPPWGGGPVPVNGMKHVRESFRFTFVSDAKLGFRKRLVVDRVSRNGLQRSSPGFCRDGVAKLLDGSFSAGHNITFPASAIRW